MPPQKSTSKLAALLGDQGRKAHEQHKGDETSFGIINLPPGIVGGVAQLVMAKIDLYKESATNAGKPCVIFRGSAKHPTMWKDVRVAGQGVLLTIPLCETKKNDGTVVSFSENYSAFLNELRKLGVDTKQTTFDNIESLLAVLVKQGPHFHFSTRGWTPPKSATNPNPTEMVFTQFDGSCEYTGGIVDPTLQVDNSAAPAPQAPAPAAPAPAAPAPAATPTAPAASEAEPDLDALAAAAETMDQDAQDKLTEMAKTLDISDEAIEETKSWVEVVALIRAAYLAPAAEPAEAWAGPKVGECYFYKPPKAAKAIETMVMAVDAGSRLCALKNAVDKKTLYKGISWDALEGEKETPAA
jgi:hypothetical protein